MSVDLMKRSCTTVSGPETLQLVDAEKEIGSGEKLLKAPPAVNPYDWHMCRGDSRIARLMASA